MKKLKKISLKKIHLKKKKNFFKVLFKKDNLLFHKAIKRLKKKLTKFKKYHKKIKNNKLLNSDYFTRIIVICFFFGINIILLPFFLETTRVKLPNEFIKALESFGIVDKNDHIFEYIPDQLKGEEPKLEANIIWQKLNQQRKNREVIELEYSQKLASAAAELLNEAEKTNFEIGDKTFIEELRTALDTAKYNYSHVSHNMIIGPLTEDAVIDAWFSDEQQVQALFEQDFIDVGFATKIVEIEEGVIVGVVVQVLGNEFENPENNSQIISNPVLATPAPLNFPPISNQEVFEALNRYRSDHDVHNLHIDENLCQYAEKRVQDLVAFGSLDNHEGFKQDFEDPENLPTPIRNYHGSTIAENLAFQHCKNMTTGDGFIAETGTAIIEWCFDSSTAGHKEAQLSKEYNDVCIRNGQGMFVVTFGGK